VAEETCARVSSDKAVIRSTYPCYMRLVFVIEELRYSKVSRDMTIDFSGIIPKVALYEISEWRWR